MLFFVIFRLLYWLLYNSYRDGSSIFQVFGLVEPRSRDSSRRGLAIVAAVKFLK